MPVVRTKPPDNVQGHRGEYQLSLTLGAMTMPRTELWYNLDLPNIPEIDLIINEPTLGAYIAEVKAFKLEEIETYNLEELIGFDGRVSQHPVKQVNRAEIALRSLMTRYADEQSQRAPFLQRTVIWPKIIKKEFEDRFQCPLVFEQAQGMLFKDDLENAETFFAGLERVTNNAIGGHVPTGVRQEQPGMTILRNLTIDLAKSMATSSHETLLSKYERQDIQKSTSLNTENRKQYLEGVGHKVAFRGYPGSGKTQALREIGIAHAASGKSVLYISFNKVLATKISIQVSELMKSATASEYVFNVHDQYQFYKTLAPDAAVGNFKTRILPKLIQQSEKGELPKYDTILIDESQDADGELFQVVGLVSHEKTSLFVAYGDNQLLYNKQRYSGGHSPELEKILADAKTVQFNRNFRSGPTTQLVCSAISDYYPNVDKAIDWLTAHINARKNRNRQDPLDFGEYTYEPKIQIADTPKGFSHRRFLFSSINFLSESAISDEEELDALIILAGESSPNYQKILEYLNLMEIPYMDLINKGNRRVAPKPNDIVITTFYGARGLTCRNAIVLDLDILERQANDPDRALINNLLNIALSRARNRTLVLSGLYENEYSGHDALRFLSALLEVLEEN